MDASPIIQTAIELSLGVLDPGSRYDELTHPNDDAGDRRERQAFVMLPEAPRLAQPIRRRDNCPSCAVGPAPGRDWLPAPQPLPQPPPARPPVTTAAPSTSPILGLSIAAALVVTLIVIILTASSGEHPTTPSLPASTSASIPVSTVSQPSPKPLPKKASAKKASDTFDVAPTFESAGTVSKDEHRYNSDEVERHLTLNSHLEGLLLKITVNILFTPAGVAHWKETEEDIRPSLKDIVSHSCVAVATAQMVKQHDDNPESVTQLKPVEVTPFRTHLQQRGLDVSGTLLYPAVLPGEYTFGCAGYGETEKDSALGKLSTPNLGVSEKFVIYKVRRAATDTVLLFGAWSHTEHWLSGPPNIAEACLMPEAGDSGDTIESSHVKLYRRWLYYKSEGYMQGALTFPVGATNIEHYRFQPECNGENEGIALAASGEEPAS